MERMEQNNYKVYVHINKINGKKYFGQTCYKNPNQRWRNGNGYIHSSKFYNAIKKYGWDNFEHIIIAETLTLEEANELEERLIRDNKTTDLKYGYNISNGGGNRTMSEETKKKLSILRLGCKNPMYGKQRSEETRKKLSNALKGKKQSKEWIEKRKMVGVKNPMYGKKRVHSKETIDKIRQANMGEKNPNFGKHYNMSEEVKEKIRVSKLGDKNPMFGKKYTEGELLHLSNITKGGNNPRAKKCYLVFSDKTYKEFECFKYLTNYLQITFTRGKKIMQSKDKIFSFKDDKVCWILSDEEYRNGKCSEFYPCGYNKQ